MHLNHIETDADDGAKSLTAVADCPVAYGPPPGVFVPLGDAAQSVVMRLRTRLPRVKVALVPAREEDSRDQL